MSRSEWSLTRERRIKKKKKTKTTNVILPQEQQEKIVAGDTNYIADDRDESQKCFTLSRGVKTQHCKTQSREETRFKICQVHNFLPELETRGTYTLNYKRWRILRVYIVFTIERNILLLFFFIVKLSMIHPSLVDREKPTRTRNVRKFTPGRKSLSSRAAKIDFCSCSTLYAKEKKKRSAESICVYTGPGRRVCVEICDFSRRDDNACCVSRRLMSGRNSAEQIGNKQMHNKIIELYSQMCL